MIVGVPKETFPGERRVALVPELVPTLVKAKMEVWVEDGVGEQAGFPTPAYAAKGAHIADSREQLFEKADVILQVRSSGANPEKGQDDLSRMRKGQVVIGSCDPLGRTDQAQRWAETGITLFSLELIPRITRAQRMDILSSMATVAGYRATLLAALELPRLFPMMMTAAGTIKPATVFVIGAGVAGLQAIATARRLGAVVQAYDIRPSARQEIESLGAKVVSLELETEQAQDANGYARSLGKSFEDQQAARMAPVVAASDVVITTAAIPGKTSPMLVSGDMVKGMRPGSVIVDLASERGGNCELTKAGETIEMYGVKILGPLNLPSDIPYHASQLFSKNITTFLMHLVTEGKIELDLEDEITRSTLVARGGYVVHDRILEILNPSQSGANERVK